MINISEYFPLLIYLFHFIYLLPHLSNRPPIHPAISLSIHPPTHPFTHSFIHSSIHSSTKHNLSFFLTAGGNTSASLSYKNEMMTYELLMGINPVVFATKKIAGFSVKTQLHYLINQLPFSATVF
jgi:hypothetical protein